MRPIYALFILPLVLLLSAVWCLSAPPNPRAQANIATLEKLLPEIEKAADECEAALAKLPTPHTDNVTLAVDGARIRIDAIRSVRTIIATQPDYLAWHIGEAALRDWKAGLDHFLTTAKAGSDPFAGKTSGIRTLRSPTDGQILFYTFRLPKDYDAKKRYPLDVSLHSGAALTWRAGWIDGPPSDDAKKAAVDDRIVISPCGRGNNSYAGMGEVAVMDAVQDAMRRYAVDPDRVTIGGASMGGTGGFRLAALHPDVFAAAHSLTGGANYSVPVGDGRYDATLLHDNFCNTALCIWDAPMEGWYKQNHAFADALRERGKERPGTYPLLELTDPKGGHGVIDRKLQSDGWDWIRQQRRNPHPQRVVYKTYNLRYTGAYWAHIETMTDVAVPARIEAEVNADKRVIVSVTNVDRFRLVVPTELVGVPQVEVAVHNDKLTVKPGETVHFGKEKGKWAVVGPLDPKSRVKRHGLSGPVQDVFMGGPVLMVHGAGTDAKARVDAAVLRLFGAGDGAAILHTPFERKADTDVTKEDMADKHLVLFGTPKENVLLAKLAGDLPVKFLADGVAIGGKEYRGEGVGLVMVYPNPLNPERYVLLLPADHAGGSPLDLPDYVVGKQSADGKSFTPLAKGTFDGQWKLP